MSNPRGRPSLYTPELAAEICRQLAAGKSLRAVCKPDHMPSDTTVLRWRDEDAEFSGQYAHARLTGYTLLAEELVDISDETQVGTKEVDKVDKDGDAYTEVTRADMIEHRKLRIDTRKWLLSKMLPKLYGDKLAVEHSGEIAVSDRIRAARTRTGG